jgi:hypothetical protein
MEGVAKARGKRMRCSKVYRSLLFRTDSGRTLSVHERVRCMHSPVKVDLHLALCVHEGDCMLHATVTRPCSSSVQVAWCQCLPRPTPVGDGESVGVRVNRM